MRGQADAFPVRPEDIEIIEKDDVVSTAILLHKFPHEVRDQMDAEDMIEVLGHQMAANTEHEQAVNKV